jgi:hypothetical protein
LSHYWSILNSTSRDRQREPKTQIPTKNTKKKKKIKRYPPNPIRYSSFEHEAFGEDKAWEGKDEEMLKILGGWLCPRPFLVLLLSCNAF